MTAATTTDLRTVRADHTGALKRPDWLLDLYARHGEGTATHAEVADGQERAVREVLAKQVAIGLPVVTDGEFCRIGGFQESFGGAVTGFDAQPYVYRRRTTPSPASQGSRTNTLASTRIETGLSGPGTAIYNRLPTKERLKLVRNLIGEEYRRASKLTSTPVKVTLIGPDRISQRFEYENSRDVYKDMDAFLEDVVAIQRQMIQEAVDAGCRYIQIDEPGYTAYVDPPLIEAMHKRGEDPAANMERSIRADNAVVRGFPGVTFGIHICRGNSGGRGGAGWHREGSYDEIAERLFGGLEFDRFLLEYDSELSGTFDALRYLPKGKMAVLGLVSNHGEVESREYLLQRLEEASKFVPMDQIAICPRCGFGSGNEDDQWAKLARITEVAREVWA
ncbi:MAG TPA: cobalamin-independent methionine synthase II family protein [Dehalococcoidia bacterium]|nr:cobalamin-independent methionine synthase II family protein [Dehalococcoidia bacterium]